MPGAWRTLAFRPTARVRSRTRWRCESVTRNGTVSSPNPRAEVWTTARTGSIRSRTTRPSAPISSAAIERVAEELARYLRAGVSTRDSRRPSIERGTRAHRAWLSRESRRLAARLKLLQDYLAAAAERRGAEPAVLLGNASATFGGARGIEHRLCTVAAASKAANAATESVCSPEVPRKWSWPCTRC